MFTVTHPAPEMVDRGTSPLIRKSAFWRGVAFVTRADPETLGSLLLQRASSSRS